MARGDGPEARDAPDERRDGRAHDADPAVLRAAAQRARDHGELQRREGTPTACTRRGVVGVVVRLSHR